MTETRRDRWGRYFVVPPDGGKPVGYTRVTTVAKTLDSGDGLGPWKATATVVGALRRPGLHARWQALVAEHPDPWYGSPESKAECKRLVEECAQAGGSADRADQGTALHAITEQVDRGNTPILLPQMQADVDAYRRALDAAGIVFDPETIEVCVVLDGHQVAGTADRLVAHVPGHGPVVADVKTGATLDYSWQSIAVQLAAYAHADAIYIQGDNPDGSQDRRLPMPQVSHEVGLVIHLPVGSGTCTLHLVDLAAGWEAFERSMWTRSWRTRKDLATPFTAPAHSPGQVEPDQTGAGTATPAPVTVSKAEQRAQLPGLHAPGRPEPDEGGYVDDATADAMKVRFGQLTDDQRNTFKQVASEAINAGVSFHMSQARTVRRFEIARGLLTVLEAGWDEEVVRALVANAMSSDAPLFPAVTVGHAVGALDAASAAQFARLAGDYAAGRLTAAITNDGHLTLHAAA